MAQPVPSAVETRSNRAFDALLWALSRPGLARDLPDAGPACIVAALIDRECRVHARDPAIAQEVLRAGAELVTADKADHVFAGATADLALLQELNLGSDLYPDAAATLVLEARIGSGPKLRITGPGVDGSVSCQLAGLPPGFWPERARIIRYPMGFDLFVVDGARVLGLPRSAIIEVL